MFTWQMKPNRERLEEYWVNSGTEREFSYRGYRCTVTQTAYVEGSLIRFEIYLRERWVSRILIQLNDKIPNDAGRVSLADGGQERYVDANILNEQIEGKRSISTMMLLSHRYSKARRAITQLALDIIQATIE